MAFAVSNSVPLTGNPLIDGLVQGGSWQFGGAPRVLTYSLNLNDSSSGGTWPTHQINAVGAALAEWAKVANVSFTFDSSSSNKVFNLSTADIAFTLTGSDLANSGSARDGLVTVGIGVMPDATLGERFLEEIGYTRSTYPGVEGDVFLDNYNSVLSLPNLGTVGFHIILHEIGHALGLKHPHDDGGNGRPTFAALGISSLAAPSYTVMEQGQQSALHVTPMLLDIAAIQAIYGANLSYNTGNDSYNVSPASEQLNPDSWTRYRTIWDAGGTDTLDFSALSNYIGTIDLRAGGLSNQGRLAIAYNVTIENANGTQTDDYIIGNSVDNLLNGNGGSDTLDGGAGNDTLNGGDGNDTYVVDASGDSIADALGTDTVQTYIPWILAAGLENLTLIGSAAYGVGNSADNTLMGNSASNPLLRGAGGNDTIMGGAGDDWIEGDDYGDGALTGSDDLQGGDGNDTILGGPGSDAMLGGNGSDTMVGDAGNDNVHGEAGIDYLDGRGGSDSITGGEGNDIIFGDGYPSVYGFASDDIHGNAGDDILMGESGDHAAPGAQDDIFGDAGNDQIYGGAGTDRIFGGEGNDVIDGGEGSDFVAGGGGADIMVGSGDSTAAGGPAATSGGDLFSYGSLADGGDSIYGFDTNMGTGNDAIDLRSIFDAVGYTGNAPRADGYLYVFQNGMNTDLYVDANGAAGGTTLTPLATLYNLSASSLTDSYFLFQ